MSGVVSAWRERIHGGGRAIVLGLGAGAVGLLLILLGLVLDARRAAASYLVAYAAALGVALGALTLVMVGHLMRVRWLFALRRLAEGVAATLPVFALLFVPIAVALGALYPWVYPVEALPVEIREKLDAKRAYLNVPFFAVRAVLYFAVWIALSWLLRRWSLQQDARARAAANAAPNAAVEGAAQTVAEAALARRQRALSAGGLPALALTLTFAAFDWLMSLSPLWYSTIYGVYVFAGGFVGALALLAVLAYGVERGGRLALGTTAAHAGGLGTFLLTCVAFWAYIAFSQLLIIWIANIPEEVTWYAPRLAGSWGALGTVLVVGHFAIPFLVLLSYQVKRSPPLLAAVGGWLLLMHYLDVYWLVLPELSPTGVRPHWLDLAGLAAVGGTVTAFGAWQLQRHALLSRRGERLP